VAEVRQTDEYERWFESLRDETARARVLVRIRRLSLGNAGDVRPVGEGVSEMRIDYGPGYRVYFVSRERSWSFSWRAGTSEPRRATSRSRGSSREASKERKTW
jgi:putative addiction module killer protein